MTATALAVELLIIGYQSLVWLALAACLSALCDNTLLQMMKDWKELTVIASIVAAYTLGAIMNGISAKLLSPLEDKLYSKRSQKPSEMRAAILVQEPQAYSQIIKNFDAPRVLRATVFNILLIGIFLFIQVLTLNATRSQLLLVAFGTLIAALFTLWAWYETAENYFIHLYQTYDALKKVRKEHDRG
jgi:hypothetical protein